MVKQSAPHDIDWLDKSEYPFELRTVEINSSKLHYVDEGRGPIILFIHGTPTWSFIYRNQIKALSKQFRCIAIDHLGFGLSDHPQNFSYTPQAHSEILDQFIETLKLKAINLVVHDFGGPIGLASAIKQPENFNSITIMNSWLWSFDDDPEVMKISKMLSGRFGRFLYTRMNFSAKFLMPKGFSDKKRLTKQLHKQYLKPFNSARKRLSCWVFARELHLSSAWFADLENNAYKLSDIKISMIWGMNDELIKIHQLKKWRELTRTFTNINYQELDNVGHFAQEEAPQKVIECIRRTAF